eukprot:Nk52_evm9s967 gene=Nk52_evmTU9s967
MGDSAVCLWPLCGKVFPSPIALLSHVELNHMEAHKGRDLQSGLDSGSAANGAELVGMVHKSASNLNEGPNYASRCDCLCVYCGGGLQARNGAVYAAIREMNQESIHNGNVNINDEGLEQPTCTEEQDIDVDDIDVVMVTKDENQMLKSGRVSDSRVTRIGGKNSANVIDENSRQGNAAQDVLSQTSKDMLFSGDLFCCFNCTCAHCKSFSNASEGHQCCKKPKLTKARQQRHPSYVDKFFSSAHNHVRNALSLSGKMRNQSERSGKSNMERNGTEAYLRELLFNPGSLIDSIYDGLYFAESKAQEAREMGAARRKSLSSQTSNRMELKMKEAASVGSSPDNPKRGVRGNGGILPINPSSKPLTGPQTDLLIMLTDENIMKRVIAVERHHDKQQKCLMPGCKKRYKNPNGIKYHIIHGHTNESVVKFINECGKTDATVSEKSSLKSDAGSAEVPVKRVTKKKRKRNSGFS